MKIKDMDLEMRPREKANIRGIESLSDRELLSLFIRFGTQKRSALDLADDVLKLAGGINRLLTLNQHDLIKIKGIKSVKALELIAIVEMGKRIIKPSIHSDIYISEPQRLVDWLNYEIGFKLQEHFLVVYLNNQNMLLSHNVLYKGTVDRSVVDPRDVLREGLRVGATRLILVHNHPGKTMLASEADLWVTQVMVRAGTLIGIDVLDHLIVSSGDYLSIRKMHAELFEE